MENSLTSRPVRQVSLDAFRGVTMLLMASEIMHVPQTLKKLDAYAGSPRCNSRFASLSICRGPAACCGT